MDCVPLSLLLSIVCKSNVFLQMFLLRTCCILLACVYEGSWVLLIGPNIRLLSRLLSRFSWIIDIHDVEGDLAADAFYNDLLRHSYSHSIFLMLLMLAGVVASYRARSDGNEVPDILLDKYALCKHCPYWPVDESRQFFSFGLAPRLFSSVMDRLIYCNGSGCSWYDGYRSHNLFNINWFVLLCI